MSYQELPPMTEREREQRRHDKKISDQIEQYDREKALHMSQRELQRLQTLASQMGDDQ